METNFNAEQARLWRDESRREYHETQLSKPYRSTVHLARFMARYLRRPRGEAIDVACGGAANMVYLGRTFPGLSWTGVDIASDELFGMAYRALAAAGMKATLIAGDFFELVKLVKGEKYDVVCSIQTLLAVPAWEQALAQLMAVTRGWLFVTSLFTDFDIDADIRVTDYTRPEGAQGPFPYNVYSAKRFAARCAELGAKEVASEDFEIDVDLPRAQQGVGTYTERLADGRRLQFSGPLHMPWKFFAIRVGEAAAV